MNNKPIINIFATMPNDGGQWLYNEQTHQSLYYVSAEDRIVYVVDDYPVYHDGVGYAIPLMYDVDYNKTANAVSTDKVDMSDSIDGQHTMLNYKGTNKLLSDTYYKDVEIYPDDVIIYKNRMGKYFMAYYNINALTITDEAIIADEIIRLSEHLYRAKSNEIYYVVQILKGLDRYGAIEFDIYTEPISTSPYELKQLEDSSWAFVSNNEIIKRL